MAKLIRVYDPDETERRINLILKEAVCPGLLEFMSELSYGMDTPLIRGIFYQWFLKHTEAGTLDEALNEVLSGPAGLKSVGSQASRDQPNVRLRKRVTRHRSATAKAGARQSATGDQASNATPHGAKAVEPNTDAPGLVEHQSIDTSQLAPAAIDPQTSIAEDSSAPIMSSADQRTLTAAQPDVPNGEQVPDADQVALLTAMGNQFP